MPCTCKSRRDFIGKSIALGALLVSGSVLSSCSSEKPTGPSQEGPVVLDLSNGTYQPLRTVGGSVRTTANGQEIIVTRISQNEVSAVRAVCTHEGERLNAASAGQILCPRHGSRFDAANGAVITGVATVALTKYPSRIEGDTIVIEI